MTYISGSELTELQKKAILEFSAMADISVRNGQYRQEFLPIVETDKVKITKSYGIGYFVIFSNEPNITLCVNFGTTGRGAGLDLGAAFCTQNQYLADLM